VLPPSSCPEPAGEPGPRVMCCPRAHAPSPDGGSCPQSPDRGSCAEGHVPPRSPRARAEGHGPGPAQGSAEPGPRVMCRGSCAAPEPPSPGRGSRPRARPGPSRARTAAGPGSRVMCCPRARTEGHVDAPEPGPRVMGHQSQARVSSAEPEPRGTWTWVTWTWVMWTWVGGREA
jgi:hypothetical protein